MHLFPSFISSMSVVLYSVLIFFLLQRDMKNNSTTDKC